MFLVIATVVVVVSCIAWLSWEGVKLIQLHRNPMVYAYTTTGTSQSIRNSPSVNHSISPLNRESNKEHLEATKYKEHHRTSSWFADIPNFAIEQSEANKCLKETVAYLREGDLNGMKKIVPLLSHLCETKPVRISFFQKLAECCLYVAERTKEFDTRMQLIDKAINACDRGLRLDYCSVSLHKCYAGLLILKMWMPSSYEFRDEYGAVCVHHLGIALQINPEDGRLHYLLGWCLYQLAKDSRSDNRNVSFEDALASFRKAHGLHVVYPRERKENTMFLGKCYLRLRDFKNCLYWLREAREIGPNYHPDIHDLNKEIDRLINAAMTEEAKGDSLRGLDREMVDVIKSSILVSDPPIQWDDIVGLENAKMEMKEAVVHSIMRPDLFTDLCEPPKGILLFGPPGTGKTLIGKCVASQARSTFFNVSVSSLTSKWVGEGEKMIRTLFAVVKLHQPAVIFIDEIDALLSKRGDSEHESSRRMKAEFLTAMDGITTGSEERLLVIGATNRPQDIDSAMMRRFKTLYIPLPELKARLHLIRNLLAKATHQLTEDNFMDIARLSEGYSGADLKSICAYAAKLRIRPFILGEIKLYSELGPLNMDHFRQAFENVKPSVLPKYAYQYAKWDKKRH